MKWNDDLEDQNSAAFKELSHVFEEEVNGVHILEMYLTKGKAITGMNRLSMIKGNVSLGNSDFLTRRDIFKNNSGKVLQENK